MSDKPIYTERAAMYHVLYKEQIIESTGHLPNLDAAKRYARKRYSSVTDLSVECAYPPAWVDGIRYPVA